MYDLLVVKGIDVNSNQEGVSSPELEVRRVFLTVDREVENLQVFIVL